MNKSAPHDSKPHDLVGTDVTTGRMRVDRVVSMQWVLSIIGTIIAAGASIYYGQQQLIKEFAEMRLEMRAFSAALSASSTKDTEHTLRLQSLEKRVDMIEARKP